MEIAHLDQILPTVGNGNEKRNISSMRRKKFLWIFFSISFIVSAVVIPTVLITRKTMTSSPVITTTMAENVSFDNTTSIIVDTKWKQNGTTVAGGNGKGNELNQFSSPHSLYVDNNRTLYVADTGNDRIVKWKFDAKTGEVVAGGNGKGNQLNQLNRPITVIVDKENDSLIICDSSNKRVVRWSRENNTHGDLIIADILCSDLAMDNRGYLYVADYRNGEVKRWRIGDTDGIIVAGGNGLGNHLNQLSVSCHIFVDQDDSVYASDWNNHRVMKWVKDAKEGVVVAGGQNDGHKLQQLSNPMGLFVDQFGSVFVADYGYNRIVRWLKGADLGSIIIAGGAYESEGNQFDGPKDLSFDEQNNIYVVDALHHQVQRFDIASD